MPRRFLIPIAPLALAAAFALGGCDDDDDGGNDGPATTSREDRAGTESDRGSTEGDSGPAADVRAVRRVIRRLVTTRDPDAECGELTTRDYVQRIYGDVPQCRKAASPDKDDEPATGVRTSSVRVGGDSAAARIRLIGGDTDGAAGMLELRREDGGWRIDDLGVDLLRSLFVKSFEDEDDEEFRRPAIRGCIQRTFDSLTDDELKRIAYMLISEREGSEEEAGKLMVPCLTRPGTGKGPRRSYLRDKLEEGIRTRARDDDLPRPVIDCIVRRLRSLITDRQLGELIIRDEENGPTVVRALRRAVLGCRSQAPPRSSS